VSPTQEAKVHTIVELALQGRLPDLTGGARYFQNEKIVAGRVAAGAASPDLVAFGGASPSAKIGAHSFFRDVAAKGQGAGGRPHRARARQVSPIFFNATHGMPGEKSEAGSPSAR
jgi:N-acetylmuramoyl-L-alanine amidase